MTPEAVQLLLRAVESTCGVEVLFAIESGSRAWGFASPDSDYDIRFVYRNRPEWYVTLEKKRDVIEDNNGVQDLSGWDVKKAAHLAMMSNPALLEWVHSPIIYLDRWDSLARTAALCDHYFSQKATIYHYLHLAEKNEQHYLRGDEVSQKKYLFVLRAMFCAIWVLRSGTQPPLPIREVTEKTIDFLPESGVAPSVLGEFCVALEALLARKNETSERMTGPRIEVFHTVINKVLTNVHAHVFRLPLIMKPGYEAADAYMHSRIFG
jgi:predicted nucleotidyltransferase